MCNAAQSCSILDPQTTKRTHSVLPKTGFQTFLVAALSPCLILGGSRIVASSPLDYIPVVAWLCLFSPEFFHDLTQTVIKNWRMGFTVWGVKKKEAKKSEADDDAGGEDQRNVELGFCSDL